ncbi:hypothetical protein [Crenothrix sp.]|uniref:hypothetical protein n=1 Tax=Crenothrix sp. TaxID=3100433 RepID=UPI00374DBECD
MKHTKAFAHLRQLCCSGLNKEIVMSEFLRDVQSVIPSGSNVFTEINEKSNFSYFILEYGLDDLIGLEDLVPLLLADFFTRDRISRFMYWLTHYPALTDATAIDTSFYKSDVYNLIYRPYNQHHGL